MIIEAIKIVFSRKRYLAGFLLGIAFFLLLFVLIPTKTIPGNDFLFQLSIFTLRNWLMMIFLSVLASFVLILNIYNFIQKRKVSNVGQGGVGTGASIVGAIFGTAACSSCIASIFGFLGAGVVFTLIDFSFYITVGAIALLLIALYFAVRQTAKVCQECRINNEK